MATTYLNKTLSGSPTNNLKWTWSAWVKKTKNGIIQPLFYADNGGSANFTKIQFHDTDSVLAQNYVGSSTYGYKITTPVYRDTNAWYHLVMRYDSANATENQRFIIWVNGVDSGTLAMDSNTFPDQNRASIINAGNEHRIGRGNNNVGSNYFDGIMSHVHFCDGYAYSASDFGSTDTTTGQWKINTSPSVSYGTNGFFILKDGNSVTDQSGQSNNFTVGGGTLTNTEDNPSNVFATWNALKKLTITLSNGNTTTSGNGDNGVWSTIGNNSGKWYWETQQNANSVMMGIIHEDVTQTTARSESAGAYGLQSGNGSYAYYRNNGSSGNSSGFPEITNSNVLCHALDLDNGKYFLGIDGVFKNLSGTTSNVGTGADPTFTGLDTTKLWFPFTESRGTGVGCDVNFGNGYFGTTAISSEGTNASGIGKFEYDVPTGYTALSTKGLNE
jgi:hypothetical protein